MRGRTRFGSCSPSAARRWWPCSSSPSSWRSIRSCISSLTARIRNAGSPNRSKPPKTRVRELDARKSEALAAQSVAQHGQTDYSELAARYSNLDREFEINDAELQTKANPSRADLLEPEPINQVRTIWINSRPCAAITGSMKPDSRSWEIVARLPQEERRHIPEPPPRGHRRPKWPSRKMEMVLRNRETISSIDIFPSDSFKTLLLLIAAGDGRSRSQGVLRISSGSPGRRRHAAHGLRHPESILPPHDQS